MALELAFFRYVLFHLHGSWVLWVLSFVMVRSKYELLGIKKQIKTLLLIWTADIVFSPLVYAWTPKGRDSCHAVLKKREITR